MKWKIQIYCAILNISIILRGEGRKDMRIKTVTKMLSAVLSAAMLVTSVPTALLAEPAKAAEAGEEAQKENLLKLWYDEPASQGGHSGENNVWEQDTLPIGNSLMGANVYGEVVNERLTFNQKTLWNGGPSSKRPNYNGGNIENKEGTYQSVIDAFLAGEDSKASNLCGGLVGISDGYGEYQSWGDIYLTFANLNEASKTNYERNLDLTTGIANVDFSIGDTDYHREYFVSYPDNVLVMKLTATNKTLGLNVRFPADNDGGVLDSGTGKDVTNTVDPEAGTIVMAGKLQDNQMKMNSVLKVQTDGTVASGANDSLDIANAEEVVIYLSADTDYKNEYPKYRTGESNEELAESVAKIVKNASDMGFDKVKERYLSDYQGLFGRLDLDIGQTASNKTTDALLTAYKNNTATDGEKRLLEVLLYQYGRYLTIASSREGDLPANLQGVWQNRSKDVAWSSDYHINVNLQMNYWPTYASNLVECAIPLIDYVESLREPGRVTAECYFGIKSEPGEANGFTAHTQTTPFGWTCPGWSFDWGWSPSCVPWILQNCWEYYEYTGDKEYMREKLYPMMKEESILYSQLLVDSGVKITLADGTESTRLVSAPAYSPEWGPRTLGNVYENTLIWQLYEDTITASEILGVDEDLREEWKENQRRLAPIEIGDSGQIKEWFNETTVSTEKHRHMSHLLGLYPGDLISVENKEYSDAAAKSLEIRGYETTGWGLAQRINAWARVGDGAGAYKAVESLIKSKIYANLWDTHPPFQIDGNFGYTAGINEMLMQSNAGYINILPAVPEGWKNGSVDGILARGNFELKIDWEEGKATSVEIESKNDGTCTVQCEGIKGEHVTVTDSKGNLVTVTPDADEEKDRISFESTKGETYTIIGFGEGIEEVERLAAPKNVAASVSASGVTLTWDAVADADYYNVYLKVNTDFVKINKSYVTATTYTDADGLELDEDARYRVAAVKEGEEGQRSQVVVANTTSVKPKAEVTITFRSEETVSSGTLPAAVQKTEGDSYTLPTCDASVTGYQFAGWSDGRRTYNAGSNYTVPKTNVTMTAVWEIDAYEKLEKTDWKATAGSEQNSGTDGPAGHAIDGNEGTKWHSNYSDDKKKPVVADPGERNEFTIDFGKTVSADKFEYIPPNGGNGFITGYRLYYSETEDGDDFIEIGNGGTWPYDSSKKTVEFEQTINMRRIKIRATETNGAEGLNKHICAVEFNVYTLKDGVVAPTGINADTEMILNIGESKQITASVEPPNASYKEITYTSSNSKIASVSADGTVTAGTRTGTAEITMTSFGGQTAICTVKVISNIQVESITLEKDSITLQPGGEIMLIADIRPYYGADKTLTWKSDDESVATVDGGKIKAVSTGRAVITATATNGMTADCEVWVVDASEAVGDKTELSTKLEGLEGKDLSGYTEASVQAYLKVLESAKKVLDSKNSSQPQIEYVLEKLDAALSSLSKNVLAEKIESLRQQIAEAEKKNLSDYTTATAGVFATALAEAKRVLGMDDASEEAIDEALQNLIDADEKLELLTNQGGENPPQGGENPPKDDKIPAKNDEIPALNSLIEDANLQYRVTKSDAINGTVIVSGVTAAGKNKSAITIPDTVVKNNYTFKVTAIDKNVFKVCRKKLKSVIIGANVTNIEANSFTKCTKLKSIRFMGMAAPTVGKNAFKRIKATCKIFYPKSMSKSELKKLKKGMKSAGKKVKYKKK